VAVNRLAVRATNHCLTGCGIGEVLGMVLATWWGWGDAASIALAIALAFFFGYLLSMVPLLRSGLALGAALGIALVADTLSIATMEIVDNAVLLLWPGAMDANLGDLLFWGSLAIALAVAWGPTFLVNRALIARGKGHARAHGHAH
jgi:UDP-3-O-acyl-N-acetylglucosamine deacetylase